MAKLISIAEAAECTGYHPERVRELAREGKIKAYKVVIVWQIDLNSLLAYVEQQQKRGAKRGRKHQR